jgi:predicted transcriptional regulator
MKATTLETCLRRETAMTVKGLAEQEQRSVSSMLRILVEQALMMRAQQAILAERRKTLYREAERASVAGVLPDGRQSQ